MSLSLPHVSLCLALPHVYTTTSAHLLRNLVMSTPPLSISGLQDSVQSIARPPLVPFTSPPLPITHYKANLSSLVSNIVVYLFAHIINWPPINVGALASPRTLVFQSYITILVIFPFTLLSSPLPTPGHRSLDGLQLLHPLPSRSLASASSARGCSSGPLSSSSGVSSLPTPGGLFAKPSPCKKQVKNPRRYPYMSRRRHPRFPLFAVWVLSPPSFDQGHQFILR